jgi:hypothetical protein
MLSGDASGKGGMEWWWDGNDDAFFADLFFSSILCLLNTRSLSVVMTVMDDFS